MKLPSPDPVEVAHSDTLSAYIRDEIDAKGGCIPFARFMEMALYTPGLGYYSAGKYKFGKSGDYVTAPEISSLFAATLANLCEQILSVIPGADILEVGAGSGRFAKDLLLELEKRACLPEKYYILEVSADLRLRQMEMFSSHCPQFLSRIQWLDSLDDIEIRGIILGNEVLDALPVHVFRIENDTIKERMIAWDHSHFVSQFEKPLTPSLKEKVSALVEEYALPSHYESEIHLMLPALIETFARCLRQGVMLFIDYGYGRREYYHPDRHMGTLMCYYRHHCHDDPLFFPGLQDITAHVDFTSLAENTRLDLLGFTTQAGFLLSSGILSKELSRKERESLKTFILPSRMGEVMKVIALGKDFREEKLLGFAFQDRRRDL